MSRRFAETHNWFLKGHRLYFEDIHICQQPGVCELGPLSQSSRPSPCISTFEESTIFRIRDFISKSRTGCSPNCL